MELGAVARLENEAALEEVGKESEGVQAVPVGVAVPPPGHQAVRALQRRASL